MLQNACGLAFHNSNKKVIFIKAIFFAEDVPSFLFRAGEMTWVGRVNLPILGSYLCKGPDNPGNLTGLIYSFKDRNI